MKRIADEFDNRELNHFTNYDYIKQVALNGQFGEFRTFIKDVETQDLLLLIRNNDLPNSYIEAINNEVIVRTS